MTKIFVTGATGLIGTKLTKRLLEEGYEVAGFTTSTSGEAKLVDAGVIPYRGNILNYETIEASVGDFKPDIILNEITDLKQVDMTANTKVRIEGTKNLVDAAIKHDVQQIQSQSIAFSYEAGEGLATEDTLLDNTASGDRKIQTVLKVQSKKHLDLVTMLYYVMVYYMDQGLGMVKMG